MTPDIWVKYTAIVFVFVVLLAATGLAIYDFIIGRVLDPTISTVLGAGIGYALHTLGLSQGVKLQPADDIQPVVTVGKQSV